MTEPRPTLRAAGAWLALASVLFVAVFALHGPLHPDLEVQMGRIAESAMRWAVAHWIAAIALSCFSVAALLVLAARSHLTETASTVSAWAVIVVGALWTLTTAITEVTVLADLASAGDFAQFEGWWSFAQGNGHGFVAVALAVAVVAANEARSVGPFVPSWSARIGMVVALLSATGWILGVWFGIGPANLLWVFASTAMCVWTAWFGVSLARTA